MKQADIPFSGILHGVDYMDRYKTFSVDTCEHRCSSSRPSQPSNCVDDVVKMAKQIQSEGFTYSLELNPTIAAEEGDEIWDGIEDKSRVFVTNDGVDPVLGHLLATKLTPDYDCENKMPYYNGTSGTGLEVSYVDYFSHQGSDFWIQQVKNLYSKIPFDGIFLKYNVPTNVDRTGETMKCPDNEGQFVPKYKASLDWEHLRDNTLCMASLHKRDLKIVSGMDTSCNEHYCAHNQYGMASIVATAKAVEELNTLKRIQIDSVATGRIRFFRHVYDS